MKKLLLIGLLLTSSAYADDSDVTHGSWKTSNMILGGKTFMCSISTKSGPANLSVMYTAEGSDPILSFSLDNIDIIPDKQIIAHIKYGSSDRTINFDKKKNFAPKENFTLFEENYDFSNISSLLKDLLSVDSIEVSGDFIKNKGWIYTTNSFNFSMNGYKESISELSKCLRVM